MKTKPKYYHAKVGKIWLDYYHELTGRTDKPHYSADGCLLHWISEYSRMNQTDILYICYEAGYEAAIQQHKRNCSGIRSAGTVQRNLRRIGNKSISSL